MIPGELLLGEGDIELNAGAQRLELEVTNTGDRPVQVGSHFHFPQANASLAFDRAAAHGHRLDIPAGTAVPPSTRSPTATWGTPSPTSSTSPQTSSPGTKGGSGRTWYSPRHIRVSAKLTALARTATRT